MLERHRNSRFQQDRPAPQRSSRDERERTRAEDASSYRGDGHPPRTRELRGAAVTRQVRARGRIHGGRAANDRTLSRGSGAHAVLCLLARALRSREKERLPLALARLLPGPAGVTSSGTSTCSPEPGPRPGSAPRVPRATGARDRLRRRS